MRIVVIRHGKVNYHWSKWYISEEFDKACGEYDQASVKDAEYKIPQLDYRNIYVSTLSRSRDTAWKLFGDRHFRKTELIDEVPLKSGFDSAKKMPLWFWNVLGRMQWAFNSSRQIEGRRRTRKRARRFVDILCRDGVDCAVVTHGFFMRTLLWEMKKAGFRTEKSHAGFRNGGYFVEYYGISGVE